MARCALLASPPDVEGAREMIKMARKTVDNNFTEPDEIGAAAARTELMASAVDAGVLTFGSADDVPGGVSTGATTGKGAEKEIEALRADVAAAAGCGDKVRG